MAETVTIPFSGLEKKQESVVDGSALRYGQGIVTSDKPRCAAKCPRCGSQCSLDDCHVTYTTTNHVAAEWKTCFFGIGTLIPSCQGMRVKSAI